MMSISWLGAPINRWIMLYAGDVTDYLLADPAASRKSNQGAIMLRFAEHPWGPWSPPIPHLTPGSPATPGDPYGPGGFLFHPDCADSRDARCARTDEYTPDLPSCLLGTHVELGRLYAPNIIDAYTRNNARGGLDISWVVSTWNPYAIISLETSIEPALEPIDAGMP